MKHATGDQFLCVSENSEKCAPGIAKDIRTDQNWWPPIGEVRFFITTWLGDKQVSRKVVK
jgi:hypothetical protein